MHGERPTWWLDTTTLHTTFTGAGRRATGIPRVVAEMIGAARRDPASLSRIRLVRFDDTLPGFREVSWGQLDTLLARGDAPKSRIPSPRDLAERLPGPARRQVRSLRQGLRSLAGALRHLLRRAGGQGADDSRGISHPFAPGDSWINLGCWWHSRLPEAISAIRAQNGAILSHVLIHDCIPLAFPEFFPPEMVQDWRRSRTALAESTDIFLTYSANTQRDVEQEFLGGGEYKADFARITLGDMPQGMVRSQVKSEAVLARLGLDQPYVLMVGTIEVRKNHALAVRAWRTMMRRGADPLPKLVFVGKWGWKIRDLRDQLRDSDNLAGHVQVLENLSDSELAAVYHGALVTLFASLYEGWGLPVRESHAHGKICVAAANSAIVEAGGDLAIYFTNDCQQSLVETVESLIRDPDRRRRHEARIAAEFSPVTWDVAWRDLASAIGRHEAAR